jgi:hypothetical protein
VKVLHRVCRLQKSKIIRKKLLSDFLLVSLVYDQVLVLFGAALLNVLIVGVVIGENVPFFGEYLLSVCSPHILGELLPLLFEIVSFLLCVLEHDLF